MGFLDSIFNYKKANDSQEPGEPIEKGMTPEELFEKLIEEYTTAKQKELMRMRKGYMSKAAFMEDVRQHVQHTYSSVSVEVVEAGIRLFDSYVFGYFRLTELIDDKDITDIKCFSWDNIRVKKNGVRYDSGISFASKEEYVRFVENIAIRNEVNISNLNAIQDFEDFKNHPEYNLRFTLIMPLLTTYGEPYMHIRKALKDFYEIPDLIEKRMMSPEVSELLKERFRNGSTLICGGTSSGKTTLLNALKETLPYEMDVLVSQQDDGLSQKNHPGIAFIHSLPKTGESIVSYDLEDISIAGLTFDIDFFILGEIKGGEAAYVLNAAYTGQLCAATIHAPSADKGIDKLVDYALPVTKYSRLELAKMMSCFDTVIFMKKFEVAQVYGVTGWNPGTESIDYEILYEREMSEKT